MAKKKKEEAQSYIIWVGNHEKKVTISAEDVFEGEEYVEDLLEAELDSFRNNLDCGWRKA
jgi:hypothetical protein